MTTEKYLMIRNPGIADVGSFTLIGASSSRYSTRSGTIGMYGSGAKLGTAKLLRDGIEPTIVPDKLKLNFHTAPETANGRTFDRVHITFSGKDLDGKNRSATEALGYTTEWGASDWRNLGMAVREFVSNAIDGAIEAGSDHRSVEIEVVDKIRAKSGHTAVFIPYTPEIEDVHKSLGVLFLHLGSPKDLGKKLLPKRFPEKDEVIVYKKGVAVCKLKGKSVFDYNLGEELALDESRNANEWDVKQAIAVALRNASADQIATVLKAIIADPVNTWEAKLDSYALKLDNYGSEEVKTERKETFQRAWKAISGENGVATSGLVAINSIVQEKGYTPITVQSPGWLTALESYGIASEVKILSKNEREGKRMEVASQDHRDSLDKVWGTLESLGLTNGKKKPGVQGFLSIMEGCSQTWGYWIPGGSDIYLHRDLKAGPQLDKVTLEECVHHVTEALDGSRDFQDYLLRAIVAIAF